MTDDHPAYVLGSTDLEHHRLMLQGHILRPWTERFLRTAGLREGMSVLDLGSGVGDVSLLAGEIVGPRGRVLGVDRDPTAVEKARGRAAGAGLSDTVTFEVTALEDLAGSLSFDAVVGRFVLLYQRDPARILRKFTRFLRPGGIVAFHEIDLTNENPSWPPCPTWDDSYALLAEVYRAHGTPPDFGRRLNRTFVDAGLPGPEIEAVGIVGANAGSALFDWMAHSLRSLEPALQEQGLALPSGLEPDEALAEALREAVFEQGSQVMGPIQYGAWTRMP
ncbi:class I SAM-dependent methyltransferase [Nonomuraea jiangxiensis]|uniref:Methyltransferase domain-containing protein n=1 Tax=Nonomuraea jiangxiensis TaxID=633440 RepID=A0A1G8M6L7_9ACTN|nr:class I SAM-dependent methyltransferase [Nonomuraea jiangxiensis]SDI63592.1 Methyltransferase domain-containing protein [Nonomuraea jiangxiensis]